MRCALLVVPMMLSPLLLHMGCAAVEVKESRTPEQIRAQNENAYRESGLERAAFDLRGAKEALRVTALNAYSGPGAQIGVECRERRAVYVFKQVGALNAAWVAETTSVESTR